MSLPGLVLYEQSLPRTTDASWPSCAVPPFGYPSAPSLRVADLFCGCGGLTLGAAEAAHHHGRRLEIALAMDTSRPALQVYEHNFAVCNPVICRDSIENHFGTVPGRNTLSAAEQSICDSAGHIDVLIAGPPCQGHSDLNNHTRRDDDRNRLYLRAVRAALILQPSVILFENVPAIRHDSTGVLAQAKRALATHGGYSISECVVSFQDLGVAQKRKRHILLGLKDGSLDLEQELKQIEITKRTVGEIIAGLEDEPETLAHPFFQPSQMTGENLARVEYLFAHNLFDLPDDLRPPCHRDKAHSYKSVYGRMSWSDASQTITSGFGSMGQGRYVHPTRPRTITPHEAARLQGFPDYFDFTPVTKVTALREMIGNAVPPQLPAILLSRLIDLDFL